MLPRLKLKGFTLSETLVGMVIMLLVIIIAGTMYQLLYKNMLDIRNNEDNRQVLTDLDFRANYDFHRFNEILMQPNTIRFSNSIDTLYYNYREDSSPYLITGSDTLLREPLEMIGYLNGESSSEFIDALEIILPERNSTLFIYKNIDENTKLNSYGY